MKIYLKQKYKCQNIKIDKKISSSTLLAPLYTETPWSCFENSKIVIYGSIQMSTYSWKLKFHW